MTSKEALVKIEGKVYSIITDTYILELTNGATVDVTKEIFNSYNIQDVYKQKGKIEGYIIMFKGKPLSEYTICFNNYAVEIVMGNPPRIFKTKKEATDLVKILNSRTKNYKYTIKQYKKEF